MCSSWLKGKETFIHKCINKEIFPVFKTQYSQNNSVFRTEYQSGVSVEGQNQEMSTKLPLHAVSKERFCTLKGFQTRLRCKFIQDVNYGSALADTSVSDDSKLKEFGWKIRLNHIWKTCFCNNYQNTRIRLRRLISWKWD